MAVTLTSTGITFSNGTTQTTKATGDGFANAGDVGELIKIDSFTSSGTWSNPGARYVHVKLVGGGGGSALYCESGGAGAYAEGLYSVSGVSTVAITVGGGGGGVGYYAAAGDGGTTSFGGYLSASGGYGANRNYSHSGGHGGNSPSGHQAWAQGGSGTGHTNSVGHWPGGKGGKSYFGGGQGSIRNHTNLPQDQWGSMPGGAPGSGAPGQTTDAGWPANSGCNGMAGCVVIYSYK